MLSSPPVDRFARLSSDAAPRQANERPPVDISPPPEQQWELRVIVWKLRNAPDDVDTSGLADWFATCRFGDSTEARTDTHWRAREGRASWNWRFKFGATLRQGMKYQRLQLSLWDKDVVSANDFVGSATLELEPWMRALFRRRKFRSAYWQPRAPAIAAAKGGLLTSSIGELV